MFPKGIQRGIRDLELDEIEVKNEVKSVKESKKDFGGYAIYRFETDHVDYKLKIKDEDERLDLKINIRTPDLDNIQHSHSEYRVKTYSDPSIHSMEDGVDSVSVSSSEPGLPEDDEEAVGYLKFALNRISREEGTESEYFIEL